MCKIFETIIRDKITYFLESHALITHHQHGFRTGHSCTTQLLELMEDFTNFYKMDIPFDCIYLDFAKASDRVSYQSSILLLLRVIKLVFSISPRISLLYRWTCWGHPMCRAVQEGCIASCVRCSLLPDRTHKSYLLRSTAISVSVPCYMWILCVVDSGISTSSMVCQILWLNFRLCWQWLCVVLLVVS